MTPYFSAGGVVLYHGDCREIVPGMPKVALVVTDPPYAISGGGTHIGQSGKGSRRLDFFDGDEDHAAIVAMWRETLVLLLAKCDERASLYAWLGHREIGATVELLEAAGWNTRMIAWVKACPAPPPPGAGWPSGFEVGLYGYRPGRRWMLDGSHPPKSNVFIVDSYRFGQPGKVNHPTQKPFAVISPLLLASSAPGDLVLDPFAGSGTTLIAAWRLERQAIGIEIEERYCEIAAKRIEAEQRQGRLFAGARG